MSASRLVTLVVAAASAYSTFVAAQTVNCGSAGRNTIISDEIFQSKKIGNTVLPKLRDTICNFTPDGYCLPFGRCVLQTIIQDGVNEIALNLNKTLIIPPGGGTAQLGPCSVIMDQIIAQCIDGSNKVTEGTVTHENVEYKISLSRAESLLTGEALQRFYISPDEFTDEVMNQLPPGIQDILKNGVTSTTAPVPPTAAPIPGGGTPNPESCITDVEGVIKNLNDIFGDTIDVHADQDKFVDFARGRDNPADNDWWRFTRSGKVSLVLGKDATHRGFSDAAPSVTKSDLISFVGARKLFFCINANPKLVGTPPTSGTDSSGQSLGNMQICLTDDENYTKCTGNVAPPS